MLNETPELVELDGLQRDKFQTLPHQVTPLPKDYIYPRDEDSDDEDSDSESDLFLKFKSLLLAPDKFQSFKLHHYHVVVIIPLFFLETI